MEGSNYEDELSKNRKQITEVTEQYNPDNLMSDSRPEPSYDLSGPVKCLASTPINLCSELPPNVFGNCVNNQIWNYFVPLHNANSHAGVDGNAEVNRSSNYFAHVQNIGIDSTARGDSSTHTDNSSGLGSSSRTDNNSGPDSSSNYFVDQNLRVESSAATDSTVNYDSIENSVNNVRIENNIKIDSSVRLSTEVKERTKCPKFNLFPPSKPGLSGADRQLVRNHSSGKIKSGKDFQPYVHGSSQLIPKTEPKNVSKLILPKEHAWADWVSAPYPVQKDVETVPVQNVGVDIGAKIENSVDSSRFENSINSTVPGNSAKTEGNSRIKKIGKIHKSVISRTDTCMSSTIPENSAKTEDNSRIKKIDKIHNTVISRTEVKEKAFKCPKFDLFPRRKPGLTDADLQLVRDHFRGKIKLGSDFLRRIHGLPPLIPRGVPKSDPRLILPKDHPWADWVCVPYPVHKDVGTFKNVGTPQGHFPFLPALSLEPVKSLHEKSLHEKSMHEKSLHEKSLHDGIIVRIQLSKLTRIPQKKKLKSPEPVKSLHEGIIVQIQLNKLTRIPRQRKLKV